MFTIQLEIWKQSYGVGGKQTENHWWRQYHGHKFSKSVHIHICINQKKLTQVDVLNSFLLGVSIWGSGQKLVYALSKLLILQKYTLWSFSIPWFEILSSLRRYLNYSGSTTLMNKGIPELLNTHQIECTLNKLVWLYYVFGYCRTVWEGVTTVLN